MSIHEKKTGKRKMRKLIYLRIFIRPSVFVVKVLLGQYPTFGHGFLFVRTPGRTAEHGMDHAAFRSTNATEDNRVLRAGGNSSKEGKIEKLCWSWGNDRARAVHVHFR